VLVAAEGELKRRPDRSEPGLVVRPLGVDHPPELSYRRVAQVRQLAHRPADRLGSKRLKPAAELVILETAVSRPFADANRGGSVGNALTGRQGDQQGLHPAFFAVCCHWCDALCHKTDLPPSSIAENGVQLPMTMWRLS
jgi:hypothetical protein